MPEETTTLRAENTEEKDKHPGWQQITINSVISKVKEKKGMKAF